MSADPLIALDDIARKIDQRGWSMSVGVGESYRIWGLYSVILAARRTATNEIKSFEGGGDSLLLAVTNAYRDALQWSRHQSSDGP